MMSPLEEAFRNRLHIYKEQKLGVSKEKNILKRLEKMKSSSMNDFNQKRQVQHTLVKNVASQEAGGSYKVGNYIPGAKSMIVGNDVTGNDNYGKPSKKKPGTKVLAEGQRWTTSGYKSINAAHIGYQPMNLRARAQNKKKEY